MPDWSPSSTPAWNPSSQTPMPTPSTPSWNSLASLRTSPDPTPATAISNLQLLGVQPKVIINSGDFEDKETAVTLELVAGQLIIRHTSYKTSQSVDLAWVSPKHPHPTCDNGLLVIIKGEHCGKYVWQIHHRCDQGTTIIIILGIVKRTENVADSLTGEQLELGEDHLCKVIETNNDKKHNKYLMTALCEQACKNHAK
ncbi:hypothetical protein L208DRAFT_1299194 [Tricholoma matsutake]|nr:hypothetical protein L208DRAFT_1299194 [Tricholoma matsutake 945]